MTDNTAAIASGATATPFILVEGEDGSGTATIGTIATGGKYKVKTGGNVTSGAFLTSDGNGAAVATTTDKDIYGAIALEAGTSGDLVTCLVIQGTVSAT